MLLIVRSFAEGLKNPDELQLGQAEKACDHGVQFVDYVFLLIVGKRPPLYPNRFRPDGESFVREEKLSRKMYDTAPESYPSLYAFLRGWRVRQSLSSYHHGRLAQRTIDRARWRALREPRREGATVP